SSAQTDLPGSSTTTTATTTPDDAPRFQFRFEGPGFDSDWELPDEIADFLACLEEQGFPAPEGGEFEFDSRDIPEALAACEFPFRSRPFGGEFDGPGFDGFPFGEEFEFDGTPFGRFGDGFPFEGFPFDEAPGDGFGFGFSRLDRDELAACLAELGSFDSVDEVRSQLDECLPEPPAGAFGFGFEWEETVPDGANI
ncbi:MAG: hypothetical protein KJO87_08740, partial [Acidimicrobiia bacterium]|nr:hypothetical protein [Acidimicrobiia bacterium]